MYKIILFGALILHVMYYQNMAEIDPQRVRLREQTDPNGFWYRNTVFLNPVEWQGGKVYIFSYPWAFRRPHSISLGAGGIVRVGYELDEERQLEVFSAVDILKSDDPLSTRNRTYGFSRTPQELGLADGLDFFYEFDPEAVARQGVALAIGRYSLEESPFAVLAGAASDRIFNRIPEQSDQSQH